MTDEDIIHVSVQGVLTEDEMQDLCDQFADAISDWDEDFEVVLTDETMSMAEVPALDEYADEIAERIADEMIWRIKNE